MIFSFQSRDRRGPRGRRPVAGGNGRKGLLPRGQAAGGAPAAPVAIERCRSYDPAALREKLDAALNLIGGLKKLVGNKTVSIKINVTGGPDKLAGLPGYRTYQIHPNLLAALCAALDDAGARRMIVLESQYSPKSPEEVLAGGGWDVRAIQSAGGNRVTFQDTRNRGKWPQYSRLKVPWGGFLFPSFDVNPCYEKTDVFISLAKLKDHLSAGVTLSIKNLFGMTPTSLYGEDAPNENSLSYRGAMLHNGKVAVPAGRAQGNRPARAGAVEVSRSPGDGRLPRRRPIDLAVIDGIETNRAGEGPWAARPSRSSRACCWSAAIRSAPTPSPRPPWATTRWPGILSFPSPARTTCGCCTASASARSIRKKIEVRGLPLKEAVYPFNPKHEPLEIPTAYHAHYDPRLRA